MLVPKRSSGLLQYKGTIFQVCASQYYMKTRPRLPNGPHWVLEVSFSCRIYLYMYLYMYDLWMYIIGTRLSTTVQGWNTNIPAKHSQWASCKIHEIVVAHAPGMPGTFSSPPNSKETASSWSRHASRHVLWCMSGSLTRGDAETFPAFPAHAQPVILRIWQEAHIMTADALLLTSTVHP